MRLSLVAAALLFSASAALAQRPSNEPLPEIHPNDRSAPSVQQRIDEIRRHNDVRDQPQLNSLESQQQQSRGSAPNLAPIAPRHAPVPDRAPGSSLPPAWPGYQPGYLPRQ